MKENVMKTNKIVSLLVAVAVVITILWSTTKIFENVDAGHIMVIQAPTSGKLTWHTSPGIKWQGYGKVTKYNKREQFWFSSSGTQGKKDDESIKIRFNDGGHAQVSGSIAWEMPIDDNHLTLLHSKYGSPEAIERQLICTVVEKAVYMTGPLMSSAESYASRRNELLNLIADQIEGGVFRTTSRDERAKDALTGMEKTVRVVEIVKGANGKPERESDSPLNEFGIKTFNLSLNEVKYDNDVEGQIKKQQEVTMQVQTAIAKAKAAEQDALTTEQEGKASAAKAKWEQETKNATTLSLATMTKSNALILASQEFEVAVLKANTIKSNALILAQQEWEVAKFKAQAAEELKKAEIATGEGEAKRRQLVMEADGALEKRIEAWVKINEAYALSLRNYNGQLVPTVVMGSDATSGGTAGGATALINMLMAKSSKDLALDFQSFVGNSNSQRTTTTTNKTIAVR